MSCMLRVFGDNLNIAELLKKIKLDPHRIWNKGDTNYDDTILSQSVASFVVSNADMNNFKAQSIDASNFLETNRLDIQFMVQFHGTEGVILDFGIELRDVAIHSDYLSKRLLKAAAMTNVEIELSHYPCAKDNES